MMALRWATVTAEHATALRMFTGSPDVDRFQQAIPDVEQLAPGVAIIGRDPAPTT